MKNVVTKLRELYRRKAILKSLCKNRLEHLQSIYPEREMYLVPLLVKKNSGSVDVGASTGIWSAHLIKKSKRVYSFEPGQYSDSFKQVVRSLRLNIKWHECALGSSFERKSTLYWPNNIQGLGSINRFNDITDKSNLASKTVATRTLDSFNLTNISFVKIDVEGHEYNILLGSQRLLAREKPALIIECEERHSKGSFYKVKSLLKKFGYKGFFLNEEQCMPLSMFSIELYQDTAALKNDGAEDSARPYLNNFIFIHEDDGKLMSTLLNTNPIQTIYE